MNATDRTDALEGEVLPALADGEPAVATRQEAEQRRGLIRNALEFAVDGLLEAYARRDYVALDYGTGLAGWRAYVADSYGDLRFALPLEARQERTAALRAAKLPVAAIAAIPGQGGQGTVARDLASLRETGRLVEDEHVDALDGRRRRSSASTRATPASAGTRLTTIDRVVAAVEAAGPEGATTLDVMRRLRWRQGPASAAMSRAARRGRLVWAGGFRDGFGVYAVPRPALEP